MDERTIPAFAKVNLTLDILRRREDGYHDLKMVMQSVSLHDTVTVCVDPAGEGITVHPGRADLPAGAENIAWRAAEIFLRETGLSAGVTVFIEKCIPSAAGMAGGSADGAAVLLALGEMLTPQMPVAELERIGALVGSDVPFCIRGGTALAEGRGEILTDLPPLPDCAMVICKPYFGLSTPELFGRVRVDALQRRPDHDAMSAALAAEDLAAASREMRNVFEEVLTEEERQEIDSIRSAMLSAGALNAVMTGSGPTVFGIFDDEEAAERAAAILSGKYADTYTVHPV